MAEPAKVEEEEKPVLTWCTLDITQGQAEFLKEQAKAEGRELSDDEAFKDACEDQDLITWAWDDLCGMLTELMVRINPEEKGWHAEVTNAGWMCRSGYKDFEAEDGKKLLQEVLPKTDVRLEIWDRGTVIDIRCWHHDSPTGKELYHIEPVQADSPD